MTEYGTFKNGLPRLVLSLPGKREYFTVEFVVDTGFDGDLTLPEHLARELPDATLDNRLINLAGAFQQRCACYEIPWKDDDGETRHIEVLVLNGNPLVGTNFLANTLLTVELTEGGEVSAESL
ncbi:MAG: hypothetical protein H8F28_02290 [Fibrella sp.]|nr:hypothetical protein [Armatimonadota bacterium]